MRKFYLTILYCSLMGSVLVSQIDTVLYEDFQHEVIAAMPTQLIEDTDKWTNYDQDGLNSVFGTNKTKRWWQGHFFTNALDSASGYVEKVAISNSYLMDALPGNRNWLILPPIFIADASFMLHWESAPRQLPRYMDGYEILISTSGIDPESDFKDTLFTVSSMLAITGNGQSTDFGNFSFTPGYMHAREGTDQRYLLRGSTVHFGLLEPHSLSLKDFVGETVRIAFLHNSDDDDRLAIDDILVTRDKLTSYNEADFSTEVFLYPNPAYNSLNVISSQLSNDSKFSFYDAEGSLVLNASNPISISREIFKIDISSLNSGQYFIYINDRGNSAIKPFSKF